MELIFQNRSRQVRITTSCRPVLTLKRDVVFFLQLYCEENIELTAVASQNRHQFVYDTTSYLHACAARLGDCSGE